MFLDVLDVNEKMSRQRVNSYSAKRSTSSKGTSIGKQLTITGKVNPKASFSSKGVGSIVEEDTSTKSKFLTFIYATHNIHWFIN